MLLVVLIVWHAAQITAWFVLAQSMPYLQYPSGSVYHPRQPILLQDYVSYSFRNDVWNGTIRYDLANDSWSMLQGRDRDSAYLQLDESGSLQGWRVKWGSQPMVAEFIDRASGRVLKQRPLPSLPMHLVNNRYLITFPMGEASWLDLDDPESELQPIEGLEGKSGFRGLFAPGPVITLQRLPPQPTLARNNPAAAPTPLGTCEIILLSCEAGRTPRVLAEWKAAAAGQFFFECDLGDSIAYLDPSCKQIEFRSKADGQVVAVEAIPGAAEVIKFYWRQTDKTFHVAVPTGFLNYDLRKRAWIKSPDDSLLLEQLEGTGLQIFDSKGAKDKPVLYDAEQQRVLGKLPVGKLHILDRDTVVLCEDYNTFPQFHFYRTSDCTLVRSYKPFRWVIPSLGAVIGLWLVWCVIWLRTSAKTGWWGWIDALLLLFPLAAVFSYRCDTVGPVWDISRLPYQYLGGVSIAGMMLCSAWFVFGSKRWPLRVLPLLVCEAVIVLLCRLVFTADPELVWRALLTVNLPAVVATLILAGLRWRGWRLVRTGARLGAEAVGTKALKLGDLFLLTVAIALISAAAGTSVRLMHSVQVGIYWSDALATVIGLTTMGITGISSLHRGPRWFAIGSLLSGMCLAVLCVEPLLREVMYNRIEVHVPYGTTEARVILTVTVAIFVCGLIYRWRGYRWGGARSPIRSKSSTAEVS